MPKSKKPRKRFNPRHHHAGLLGPVPKHTVAYIDGVLRAVETGFLLRLRQGQATAQDTYHARDIFNLAMFALCHRRNQFNSKEWPVEEMMEQILQAGMANRELMHRIKERGTATCWVEESDLLLDTLEACCRFCREQLQACPGTFVCELNASKILTDGRNGEHQISVTQATIDWAYEQAVKIAHMQPEQQEQVFREVEVSGIVFGQRIENLLTVKE